MENRSYPEIGTHSHWSHYNPTRINFGNGARKYICLNVSAHPTLIVTSKRGRKQFEGDQILSKYLSTNRVLWYDDVSSNPDFARLSTLDVAGRYGGVKKVVAFGGGSAIDTAKIIAAQISCIDSEVTLSDLILKPDLLSGREVPSIYALPTTSGTGAEVTPFATIWDNARKKKYSLQHEAIFPTIAIVDPELTLGLPVETTVSTAFDALNQAFEAIWNRNASEFTMQFGARAIGLLLSAIGRLEENSNELDIREQLANGSLLSGLCISQSRTSICHAMSYPLTAHFGVDHGNACAFTMLAVAETVIDETPALMQRVAEASGYRDAYGVMEALRTILQNPHLLRAWAPLFANPKEVLALSSEMFIPGRTDNFIVPVDKSLMHMILKKSLAQRAVKEGL